MCIERSCLHGQPIVRLRGPALATSLTAPPRERLDALGPAARAELLHILRLPDLERVERIGEFWGHPETQSFGELLIDLEED